MSAETPADSTAAKLIHGSVACPTARFFGTSEWYAVRAFAAIAFLVPILWATGATAEEVSTPEDAGAAENAAVRPSTAEVVPAAPFSEPVKFDASKYRAYTATVIVGSLLIAGSVGICMPLLFHFVVDAVGLHSSCDPEDDDGICEAAEEREHDKAVRGLIASLVAGATGLSVGIPLLIYGSRRLKTQRVLRERDTRYGGRRSWQLSALIGAERNAGGARLSISLSF